jgi:hypothetical protein
MKTYEIISRDDIYDIDYPQKFKRKTYNPFINKYNNNQNNNGFNDANHKMPYFNYINNNNFAAQTISNFYIKNKTRNKNNNTISPSNEKNYSKSQKVLNKTSDNIYLNRNYTNTIANNDYYNRTNSLFTINSISIL